MRSSLVRVLFFAAASLVACGHGAVEDGEGTSQDDLSWEPVSTVLGDTPNFAQVSNGSALSVVSRGDGRGAKAGALIELFYPKLSSDNLWDSYVGLSARGRALQWAHQMKLEAQRLVPDAGHVQSDFTQGDLFLRVEDVMRPTHDAHLRRIVVTNRGTTTLEDVDLTFYAFFTLGTFPTGDSLRFDDAFAALIQEDKAAGIAAALVSERRPDAVHCGYALRPWGAQKDARRAAERGRLEGCPSTVEAAVTGVNGAMRARIGTLRPGASDAITFAIGLGADGARALQEARESVTAGFEVAANEDRAKWGAQLDRARTPRSLPSEALPVYRRALLTMLQHQGKNGAFIAAPTLTSPGYRFVWPRDGSKTAIDALEAGYAPEAARFFEFLETLLLPNGSFAVNYYPDGSGAFWNFGADGNENDQPGMLPWGVAKVFDATADRAWLSARWPAVQRVAEHLVALGEGGLVAPSRDLWELETGSSWTYANGSAIAGLESAAKIAITLGHAPQAERWTARARELRTSLETRLVSPGGYFARGATRSGETDDRLEIANLALGRGGFALLPDTDPRLARVGDLVTTRLMTPQGSVRRYEGDRYYGGQPWPVAAAWLAGHRQGRGEIDAARALFATMTRQARSTESLMLGEQFDEEKKVWVSAMPLVWSEAAYVRTALSLYGQSATTRDIASSR